MYRLFSWNYLYIFAIELDRIEIKTILFYFDITEVDKKLQNIAC